MLETLSWFLFEKYNSLHAKNEYELASHPKNQNEKGNYKHSELPDEYKINHPDGLIFLTDVFRLH
jgi:hypothetical protein